MAKLGKIVAFVATKKPEQAKQFYRNKLGLKFLSDDGFALVFDIQGTMLRIAKVKDFTPAAYTVLGWEVSAIEESVAQLAAKGVKLGIWAAPGGAKVAWFKDPDGNILSLSQHPGQART